MLRVAPDDSAVELRFISAPEVPTAPSQSTGVPVLTLVTRNQPAVPVAEIVTGEIVDAVKTPLVAVSEPVKAGVPK